MLDMIHTFRKKLISLSSLNYLGYCYSAKDEIVKTIKCALMVMKCQNIDNLYKLLRNIIASGVATSTLIEIDINGMVLRHMRLGHLGKFGMFELYMRNILKCVKSYKLDFCNYFVCEVTGKYALDYVHSYVWRLIFVSLNEGAYYFYSFIDDFFKKGLSLFY